MNLFKTFKTWLAKVYSDQPTDQFNQYPGNSPTTWGATRHGLNSQPWGSGSTNNLAQRGQGLSPEIHQDARANQVPQPQSSSSPDANVRGAILNLPVTKADPRGTSVFTPYSNAAKLGRGYSWPIGRRQ